MPDTRPAPCTPNLTPLEELEMCQVEFWLHIMRDHAMFIKGGLPCDATELRDQAQGFFDLFDALIRDGCKVKSDRAFQDYIRKVQAGTADFCQFKTNLLRLTVTCQLPGTHLPASLLAHVRREAGYFLGLLAKMTDGSIACPVNAVTAELSFWTEIMKEHLAANDKLLDPSEAKVQAMMQDWLHTFTALSSQSRALQDFLQDFMPVPDLLRFIEDVQQDTCGLRDFQTSLVNLINQCRLLQVMPPGFVAHQNRETEHFLQLLSLLRDAAKQQKEPCVSAVAVMPAGTMPETTPKKACPSAKVKAAPKYAPSSALDEDETPPYPATTEEMPSCAEPLEETPAVEPPPIPCKPYYPPASFGGKNADDEDSEDTIWKPGKYKWSGHWPRPLGKQPERGREKKRK